MSLNVRSYKIYIFSFLINKLFFKNIYIHFYNPYMNSFVKKKNKKNVSYLHKKFCPKFLGQGIKSYKSSKKYKS